MNKFDAANTALGRVGEADDIGGVVASLCTEEMGFVLKYQLDKTCNLTIKRNSSRF